MDHHPIRAQTQPQPKSERWAPEIYVHLEFRVSWGGKKQQQQPSKNHQITFRSRGPRERSPAFPRQVPAPNTNYLAAIHNFDQRQARVRETRQNNPHRHHQMQEYYQGEQLREQQRQQQRQQSRQPPRQQPPTHLQVPIIREPERPTRADTRSSSHERGRSAPPPIGENPWDVNIPHLQARNSEMTPSDRPTEIRRKPLPAPPSQFRLGDGGQPWSTWSLPDGYDPDTHPKDEEDYGDYDTYEDIPVISEPGDRNSTTYATNPTMVSTFSPEPTTFMTEPTITVSQEPEPRAAAAAAPVRARDVETGRAKELGALSAAMMTVDNGFETQWWNQGQRDTVFSGTTDDPTTPDESPIHRWSTGPMSMSSTASPVEARLPAGVVSPLTDAAFSPAQVPASLLQRTLSTRSEELWFREGNH
ncbi:uncharacterized protein B0H64DRAFT_315698 [Chaetomium fimeti]|uniref:Uncharacterized protein n=1 Tax=Chaetomium fimeti TaxID=1854472 RepID=A0AAE0LXT2_9PEZI|nr:hypothetical protein B0H64DRAFT_315698 [Chaetomium fimeti]